MADPNTRQGKRTPVTLKIKFKSETLEQFIERYAVDVSQGGIFIRTKDPLAVGTQMKFEFQLRDASPLIAGEGTVVWTRENDPSRPAIAPGMGVRFDRLADGSQTVLEKILAEKAKQAPSRSGGTTMPGQNADQRARDEAAAQFADTPTRVAPANVQEALGLRSRTDDTPLPAATPFQTDAGDFDDKAFEEATKVRSLDDLALATEQALSDDPRTATKIMPPDELAVRRSTARADSTLSDPPLAAPPDDSDAPVTVPDRESAPSLPNPPPIEATRPRRATDSGVGDVGASKSAVQAPRAHPSQPIPTQSPNVSSGPIAVPPADDATPRPVAAEPSRPTAPSRPSSAPIIIGILLVVVGVIGAVWWFVLRDPGTDTSAAPTSKPTTTTPTTTTTTPPTTTSGSAAATTPATGSDTTTPTATGSGSAAGSAATGSAAAGSASTPAAPTVDTAITASVAKGATVEIVGTEQKGPAPFTAKLEKGKAYKARVTAEGFQPAEIDVKGGEKATAKLDPMPHLLHVSSDPAGAAIWLEGVDTKKVTPADVELTPAQALKPRVRVSFRLAGFRAPDQMIETSAYKDEAGKLAATIAAKLTKAVIVRPPTPTGGTGSAAGSGDAGGGTESGGTGSDAPAPAPTPPPAPPADPIGGGSVAPSGSTELK